MASLLSCATLLALGVNDCTIVTSPTYVVFKIMSDGITSLCYAPGCSGCRGKLIDLEPIDHHRLDLSLDILPFPGVVQVQGGVCLLIAWHVYYNLCSDIHPEDVFGILVGRLIAVKGRSVEV